MIVLVRRITLGKSPSLGPRVRWRESTATLRRSPTSRNPHSCRKHSIGSIRDAFTAGK